MKLTSRDNHGTAFCMIGACLARMAISLVAAVSFALPAFAGAITIADASFETPALSNNNFVTNPSGLPWTFNPHSGIIRNSSAWQSGGILAPDGNQIAYLQSASPGSSNGQIIGMMRQTITVPDTGSYFLSYFLAGRTGPSGEGGNLPFDIWLNGFLVVSDSSSNGMAFQSRQFTISATAGTYDLLFQARRPVPDNNVFHDNIAYLDKIQITPVPEPTSFAMLAVAGPFVATLVRSRRATSKR